MATKNLELNLRARADIRDIDKLERSIGQLAAAMRRSGASFDGAADDARRLAQVFGQLSAEEQKQVQSAAKTAAALDQAAAARERASRAAAESLAAEQRIIVAQEAAERAAIQTATANERLAQAQSRTVASVAGAATAEERLAQSRERTLQATARTEREEINVAKAREQLRAATARAEAAEKRMADARRSSGLATDIVRKQLQAFLAGGTAIMVGKQLLQLGRDSITAASDAEEAGAKFRQVFGDLSEGVRENLEVMAKTNRRSVYDLVDFASTLQDTFVPLGFAREQAADFSQTIVQLGVDIAAFSNKADADVINNLTSAIVGNHEAVRSYGIVLTETVLKQELARMGAQNLTGAALEMAKAQARVNVIMRASADAQGAAVREADSYSNTLKAWDAAVQDLKVALGTGLLPAMTSITEAAVGMANSLSFGRDFQKPFDDALAAAKTSEEIVAVIQASQNELDKLDFWDWFKVNVSGADGAMADKQLQKLALSMDDVSQFTAAANNEINLFARSNMLLNFDWDEDIPAADQTIETYYRVIRARHEMAVALAEQAEMEAAYQKKRQRVLDTDVSQVSFVEPPKPDALAAWGALADDLGRVYDNAQKAKDAQLALNAAFAENFQAAPVDDLIKAQQDLQAATGEWRTATIDNSGDIAAIQRQLAADLTAEQKSELQKQLKDLDSFSDEYLAIVGRLEGDLSDKQRLDLSQQLAALEDRQGQTTRAYTGDTEAAEDARDAIIAANKAIQDSYYERAYNSIAARLIEEGNFEQLAGVAVSLGIMTQAEADLRLQYAETVGALDTLTQSTAFYGLTAAQQAGAIKSLAAGVYETADAALQAQQNLQATQDFFSQAPDSSQIGNYYQQLANGANGADGNGITTTIGVVIDPVGQREFDGFRAALDEYDTAIYETTIQADSGTTQDDFEDMRTVLEDLVANTWVIKVKYETEGSAPSSSGGTGGGGPEPRGTTNKRGDKGAYVDLTVNNYGGGDVSGAVRNGVLAAFRSLG